MRELNLYCEEKTYDYGLLNVLEGVRKKLILDNSHVRFNWIESKTLRQNTKYDEGPACKFGPFFLIIENPKNKKFIVVSFWDQIEDFFFPDGTYWDMENCVEILTSVGAKRRGHTHELPTDVIYTPISYMPFTVRQENKIEEFLESEKTVPLKPSFQGHPYDFREFLLKDSRFEVLESVYEPDIYIKRLSESYLGLSINGAGEISHRDVEIMGCKSALFRTEFSIRLHEHLIPNHHYISVDWKDISFGDVYKAWKEMADRIIDRFESVKNDIEYLKFVGQNGRDWYLRNGTHERNIEIICELINLDKLF